MDDAASDSDTSLRGKAPDWGRFGLSEEQQRASGPNGHGGANEDEVFEHHNSEHNELFREDLVSIEDCRSLKYFATRRFASLLVLFTTFSFADTLLLPVR